MSDQLNSAGGENSSDVESVSEDEGRAADRPAKRSPLSKVVKWGIGIVVAATVPAPIGVCHEFDVPDCVASTFRLRTGLRRR